MTFRIENEEREFFVADGFINDLLVGGVFRRGRRKDEAGEKKPGQFDHGERIRRGREKLSTKKRARFPEARL